MAFQELSLVGAAEKSFGDDVALSWCGATSAGPDDEFGVSRHVCAAGRLNSCGHLHV